MQVFHSKEEHTYNFIHDSGVQTSIKVNPSGSFTPEDIDNDTPYLVDKQKYTVIISCSKGCQMSCDFCHLTQNKKEFSSLDAWAIIFDVSKAIEYVSAGEELESKYIKLCFMGEGEAIIDMKKTKEVAEELVEIALAQGWAKGLDGVDISTCMPKVPKASLYLVNALDYTLQNKYRSILNPYNHGSSSHRTVVRVFYSLHHYSQFERDKLIPNTHTIERALHLLDDTVGVNKVIHYMFMAGVNDSERDVTDLISFVNNNPAFREYEFRVLRYNSHGDLDMESERLSSIVSHISKNLNVGKFKVQFSAGQDIKAACGMFI